MTARRRSQACLAVAVITALLAGCSGGGHASKAASTTAAVASPGCRGGAALPRTAASLSFSAAGKSGTYIQDVPSSYAARQPTPVVFDLHGYLEDASFEHLGTALSQYGDAHGFLTVTPQIREDGPPRWDVTQHSPDLAWLGALLTHVEQSACVDERRVYFAGLSMGAFMSSAVACELSGRVAAVAPVAGVQALPWCRPTRPVPVVAFHGTADPYVAFTGGAGAQAVRQFGSVAAIGLPKTPIRTQVATWAARNGCASKPDETRVAADVTRVSYRCAPDASVVLYVIDGGGHTWPGGPAGVYPVALVGRTTTSINADRIMWDFFQAHPLHGVVASPG